MSLRTSILTVRFVLAFLSLYLVTFLAIANLNEVFYNPTIRYKCWNIV